MRLLSIVTVIVLAVASACDRPTDLAGLSEDAFVSVMADLRRIERDATLDSVAKTTARDSTLQERNLTPEELEAAARALAADPEHALTVWARIDTLAMREPGEAPADTAS